MLLVFPIQFQKYIIYYHHLLKRWMKFWHLFILALANQQNQTSEMLGGSMKRQEKARHLITKIVNALTAKMEIGGPMACLYLLGNPDHYTNHNFVTVYWKNYVREVANAWSTSDDMEVDDIPEKLVLKKTKESYVGYSAVHDYI